MMPDQKTPTQKCAAKVMSGWLMLPIAIVLYVVAPC